MKKYLTPLGFTLVELIIAITIITILTTFGVASYNSARVSNDLRQQAQELKSLARKLRTDAVAATKPSGNCQTSGTVYGTYLVFQKSDVGHGLNSTYYYGTACYDAIGNPLIPANTGTLHTGIYVTCSSCSAQPYIGVVYFNNGQWSDITPSSSFPPLSITVFSLPSLTRRSVRVTPTPLAATASSSDYNLNFSPTGLVCEEKYVPTPTCY